MDEYKKTMKAVDAPSIIAMGDYVAPTLLSMGVKAALQAGQMWCQAVTTNVPGPRIPLYVLGKRMSTATAYVPIAGGTRCSIGIFSYLNTMTFGINADFDGYPDVDVLSGGIRKGIEELLALAAQRVKPGKAEPKQEPAAASPPAKRTATARTPAAGTAASGAAANTSAAAKMSAASGTTTRTTATKRTAAKKAAPRRRPTASDPGARGPARPAPPVAQAVGAPLVVTPTKASTSAATRSGSCICGRWPTPASSTYRQPGCRAATSRATVTGTRRS